MCGISGIAGFGATGIVPDALGNMTNAIRHRGPDDEGCFADAQGRAVLGHRRLSIIDLTTGHQPVFNEDGTIAVVFNGEIYNYLELRATLENNGHRFATRSDTEVMVHLYEEMGPHFVERLRGMFAVALWDARKGELLLARDRVGKKPLYYAVVNGTLYFASEIHALYEVSAIARDIDYEAIDLYLTYSFIPSPRTIYRSIHKLPPAHTLVFNERGLAIDRYWRPECRRKTRLDYEEAKQELVRILSDSVRLRLISDVALGAFLSGGIDSSTIVALMSRVSNAPVKTFSIGFPDPEYDELPYARQLADVYQTEHHEFIVEPQRLDVLGDIVRHYGEPYGDSSAVPTWHLSRVTRQHVTVALNGDGGDELFAGYTWYQVMHRLNQAANPVSRAVGTLILGLGRGVLPRRARRGLELLVRSERQRFQELRSYVDAGHREHLYHDDFKRRLCARAEDYLYSLYDLSLPDARDRALQADFHSYLPEDLLVKVDRASMAHGLECRSPLLDQELVEFACSLPADWKIRGNDSKRILKDAVGAWFPRGFLDRPKQGFSVPLGNWFRGELKPFITDHLTRGPFRHLPLFRPDAIDQILREHFDGSRNHETRLWNLLMLSLWFEEFGAVR